jgi:hypothetical protein
MTDVVMAADTVKLFIVDHPVRGNFTHEVPVTIQAVGIQYSAISRLNANWIAKIPKRKGHGMMIAVLGLCHPFADKIVWRVAVVADGESVMTGFLPAVIFALHHVTVHTRLWIVRKIGRAPRIVKCVSAGAQQYSQQRTKQQPHFLSSPIHFHLPGHRTK